MDLRRRPPPPSAAAAAAEKRDSTSAPKASDALPLPLYLTNAIFFTLFFSVAYFLLHRWRDKIRSSTPLHVVTPSEIAAIFSLIASFIYLLLLPLKPGIRIRPNRLRGPALLAALDAFGEGVVDSEDAAVELGTVHVLHGRGGVVTLEEGDEAEGTVLLRGLIQRRLHVLDVAEGNKGRVEDGLVNLLR